jgi:hypothetical protein
VSSVLLLFAALAAQNFSASLSPVHSVSGTVTNGITGLPISGATVTLIDSPLPPAITDDNGFYLFPSVPDGTYDIQASVPGLLSLTQSGVVVDDDIVVDFTLDSAAICDHVPGNLVANCGFETGDFTAWARSGDTSFTSIDRGAGHSGMFGLVAGPSGLGFIAQNLATTPGGTYSICYWLLNLGGPPNRFQVSWGGTVIRDEYDLLPWGGYMQFCQDAVAPSDTTEVKFGFQQLPSFFLFDDVSVAPQ